MGVLCPNSNPSRRFRNGQARTVNCQWLVPTWAHMEKWRGGRDDNGEGWLYFIWWCLLVDVFLWMAGLWCTFWGHGTHGVGNVSLYMFIYMDTIIYIYIYIFTYLSNISIFPETGIVLGSNGWRNRYELRGCSTVYHWVMNLLEAMYSNK